MRKAVVLSIMLVFMLLGSALTKTQVGTPNPSNGAPSLPMFDKDSPRRDMNPVELDSFIIETMDGANIRGLSAGVVKHGRIGWVGNYGWANIEADIPVTENTVFLMASLSKTVTAVAIMQLWEEDRFELDDPINDYLPDFEVIHPDFPNTQITFRMLLTHTAGFKDNWGLFRDERFYSFNEDSPYAQRRGEFLQEFLVEGDFFNEDNYWRDADLGRSHLYNSVDIDLIGYLVECIAGQDFAEYCQDRIFTPLGMESASWFLDGFMEDEEDILAMPYWRNGQANRHFHLAQVAAAMLRTSAHDWAKFQIAMTQYGRYGDIRILDSTTVERMLTVEIDEAWGESDIGIVWYRFPLDEEDYWIHAGTFIEGVGNQISLHPASSTGLFIFTNRWFDDIEEELFDIHWELYNHSFEWMNFGAMEGIVIDAETDEPIAGATVSTTYGRTTQTDEDGYYFLSFGDSVLTASISGYNTLILTDLELAVDETLEVDFHLTHPEISISVDNFNETVLPNSTLERLFTLSDSGNGTLEWDVKWRLQGESGVDNWIRLNSWASAEMVGDAQLKGMTYADGYFYVCGRDDDGNMIYVLSDEGVLSTSYRQLDISRSGMADLTWDGDKLWGIAESTVYGFQTNGDSTTSFEAEFNRLAAVAWDTERNILWISETLSDIHGYNRNGEHGEEYVLSRNGLRIYALAYWEEDPDGYPLYIFTDPAGDELNQVIYKMNLEDNDTMYVTALEPEGGGSPGGACITNQFDGYGSWVFMNIVNGEENDRLDVWMLHANTDWMNVQPATGVLEAGESDQLTLTLNTFGLDSTVFWLGEMVFSQSVGGAETIIPVEMNISSLDVLDQNRRTIPRDFGISSVYPNPFNSITTIKYTLPIPGRVLLNLYDVSGRNVGTLFEGYQQDGYHSATLNAYDLPSGFASISSPTSELLPPYVFDHNESPSALSICNKQSFDP